MTIAERLKQEARREAQREIARAMLRKGMEPNVVMEITGLSKEELAKIQH